MHHGYIIRVFINRLINRKWDGDMTKFGEQLINEIQGLEKYIGSNGVINIWPSEKEEKLKVLRYLSTKFEHGKEYTEKEVNYIIGRWHSFGDYFLLRRHLVDYKFLFRTFADDFKYCRDDIY